MTQPTNGAGPGGRADALPGTADHPRTPEQRWAAARLRAALDRAGSTTPADELSDEQLAAFVEGTLPEAERQRVIAAIADDPDLAALVAELSSLRGAPALRLVDAGEDERRAVPTVQRAVRPLGRAWLGGLGIAAACMLGLTVWTIARPMPSGPGLSGFGALQTQPDAAGKGDEYWRKLSDEERERRTDTLRLREYALYASVFSTGVLAVVVVVLAFRRSSNSTTNVTIHKGSGGATGG